MPSNIPQFECIQCHKKFPVLPCTDLSIKPICGRCEVASGILGKGKRNDMKEYSTNTSSMRFYPEFIDTPILDLSYSYEPVSPVRFSPNGELIATGHKANAHLWSTQTGKHIKFIGDSHTNQINDICFDDEGEWVFSCAHGETIKGYEISAPHQELSCHTDMGTHPKTLIIVESSPPMLVCATSWKLYFFEDLPTRIKQYPDRHKNDFTFEPNVSFEDFGNHEGIIRIFWHKKHHSILIFTEDGKVFEFSIDEKKNLQTFSIDIQYMDDILMKEENYSPKFFCIGTKESNDTAEYVVTELSQDGFKTTGEIVIESNTHGKPLGLALDSREEVYILTEKSLLHLEYNQLCPFPLNLTAIDSNIKFQSVDLANDMIVIGHSAGGCLVWRNGTLLQDLDGHQEKVTSFERNEKENRIISHSRDKSILWDTDTHKSLFAMSACNNTQRGNPMPDVSEIRYVGFDNKLYDSASGKHFLELEVPESLVSEASGIKAVGFSRSYDRIWGIPWSHGLLDWGNCYSFNNDPYALNVRLLLWDLQGKIIREKIFSNCHRIIPANVRLNVPARRNIILHEKGSVLLVNNDTLEIDHRFEVPFPITCYAEFDDGIVFGDHEGCVRIFKYGRGQVAFHKTINPKIIEVACDKTGNIIVAESVPADRDYAFRVEVFSNRRNEVLVPGSRDIFPGLLLGAWPAPSGNRFLVSFGAYNTNTQYIALYSAKDASLLWASKIAGKPVTAAAMISDNNFVISLSKRIAFFKALSSDTFANLNPESKQFFETCKLGEKRPTWEEDLPQWQCCVTEQTIQLF